MPLRSGHENDGGGGLGETLATAQPSCRLDAAGALRYCLWATRTARCANSRERRWSRRPCQKGSRRCCFGGGKMARIVLSELEALLK